MRLKLISYITLTTGLSLATISCSEDFLTQNPKGTYSDVSLQNKKGVEGMLIGAYAALDGSYFESWDNNFFNQNAGASNWIWGGVRSEEAYKGTEESDGVDITPIERYQSTSSNNYYWDKWRGCYDGISKANQALRTLRTLVESGDISAEDATRIEGEARFLRGHYHFEAMKVFGVPAYVDETLSNADLFNVTNEANIWPNIEADFQFAYANLPGTQLAEGRANKWAAGAYLGKTYVYQAKWTEALTVLTDVVNNGTTSTGVKYKLMDKFADNYVVTKERGSTESVFAYEASAYDGTIGNGNYENTLNQPHGSSAKFAGCCGFYQPSQNMVNSFKVDANGLPMPDTFNDTDLLSDEGKTSAEAFTPDGTTALDPRLDWTVGRRGIPYLDWGLHPGNNWIRKVSHGGPYSPKKNVPYMIDRGTTAGSYDWGFTATAQNVHIIRFADVLLLAAEAEAEAAGGNLANALSYVNLIRNRAKNSPVFTYVNNADPSGGFTTTPAANYDVEPYPSFADATAALTAIRFERKLELGMEGHRFFDLVRWDNYTEAGKTKLDFDIAAYLNEYLAGETGSDEPHPRSHLDGASFTEKYKYAPIPENAVTLQTQNGVKLLDQSKAWGGTRDYPTL